MTFSSEDTSPYSVDDFRKIQDETTRASSKLNEMRKELKQKMEVMPKNLSLPALAKALSPTRLAPPVLPSMELPITGGNDSPYSAISEYRSYLRPPVGLDDSDSDVEKRNLFGERQSTIRPSAPHQQEVNKQLQRVFSDFEEKVELKLFALKSESQKIVAARGKAMAEIEEREADILTNVRAAIEDVLSKSSRESFDSKEVLERVVAEGMKLLQERAASQQQRFDEMEKTLVSKRVKDVTEEVIRRVEQQLDALEDRVNAAIEACSGRATNGPRADFMLSVKEQLMSAFDSLDAQVNTHLHEYVQNIGLVKNTEKRNRSVEGLLQRMSPTTLIDNESTTSVEYPHILEENKQLRSLVRKMKLALSKWRVDYLSNGSSDKGVQKSFITGSSKAVTPSTKTPSNTARIGEEFHTSSDNLMRMWTAVSPSSQELIQFLVNMEASVDSEGKIPIVSVYDYECRKNMDKLPIAQMAAQREFLMSQQNISSHNIKEIHDLEIHLIEKIREFEIKYQQKFVFHPGDDDEDYIKSIHKEHPHFISSISN